MPPKTKKSTPASAAAKRVARKVAAKSLASSVTVCEVKADETGVNDSVKVAVKNTSKISADDLNVVPKSEENGSLPLKKEDEVKEDEYERGEHLDLDDNEPEYEPEEYAGDYDENDVDPYDFQEGYEVVEEVEEGEEEDEEEVEVEEEEDGDMVKEEDALEDLDGEDDDEQVDASDELGHEEVEHERDAEHKHADLVDAAEEHEHHEVIKERRKRKEFEVFVGGLDKGATEADLQEVFGAVGVITEVRLMINPQTKKNKGFAFLRFATVEQAKRAVELNNPVVKGKQCGVSPSQDNDTLFLGNICKTWTKEKLKDKLKLYGIENIEELTIVEDSNNEGKNRGFAFLEFLSRSEAMDAFKRLQKKDVLLGVEKPAKVSFADSFISPGDEIMSQVKTVFIDGLSAAWDEDHVRNLLKKYGKIEKVGLARNMPSARRKDFGFVTFDSHTAAVACAKSINNVELGEGDHKAKVRVRLSRPLQRGKGKKKPRSDRKDGRVVARHPKAPWNRQLQRPLPARVRVLGSRAPVAADRPVKRLIAPRGRRPPPPLPPRERPLPPPRSYERRIPAPPSQKSNLKREYSRRDGHPPRSKAVSDYASRLPPEHRPSHRDDYDTHAPIYSDMQRSSASRSAARRSYADDSYGPRYERLPPSYREGRARDYDSVSGSKRPYSAVVNSVSGSKRPYSAVDDAPSRYSDPSYSVRHSRARADYDIPGSSSHYTDTYGDRSTDGYGSSSRSSLSTRDSHGPYSSRQRTTYSGSYGGSDGVYSSSYGGDYSSRGSDAGGSSYSSLYSSRGVSDSSYMGGGSSSSYY